MRIHTGRLKYLGAVLLVVSTTAGAAGPLQRLPNTSLTNMPSAPPTFGFTSINALGNLAFNNPVAIVTPPGETNRLFVVEKGGIIVVVTNLASPTRSVFMNISSYVQADAAWSGERGLLGMAFHPGYLTNRYFFVFYMSPTAGGSDTLERYQISAGNTNQGDPLSYVTLFEQVDQAGNHNGGDLHFGPDGYLYVSLGDEGGQEGEYGNTQKITNDFFSAILRLDVDKRGTNLPPNPHPALGGQTNYFVPADNPYVGATSFNGLSVNPTKVRTEFWAVGFRNPWRFSFDRETGTLYCGDVGQSTLEEVDLVTKGGNYGWNFFEGTRQRTNNAQLPPGFTNTPPLLQYGRTNGIAITGGRVYRGQQFTQLYGDYIYADSGSGRIWALEHSGTNIISNTLLMIDDDNGAGYAGVSAFGTDPRNGDILYADIQQGTGSIKRLVYSNAPPANPIPTLLSATGAFTNLTTLAVAPGITAYDLNTPFWSDNAIKSRWFSVPNTNLAITFSSNGNYSFPTGTVWIKHFELEITNGVPASRRRLETRLLVKNATGGYGVTYRWTIPPTNAILVAEGGFDEAVTNYNNGGGILGTQIWHYPSRVECLQCHTLAAGFGLGFNTPQLNRDFTYGATITNQIQALSLAGYFSNPVNNPHLLPALASATNDAVSLEYRVRSYFAANCVSCHQPGGTSQAQWDARPTTPSQFAGVINAVPFNNFGDPNNRVIAPGSLSNSILFQRVANLGPGHMPPLSTAVVNTQAVALLAAWITNDLPGYVSFATWQSNYFGSSVAPNAAQLADPDGDRARNYLEYLTGTDPTNAASAWSVGIALNGGNAQVLITQPANRAVEVQATTNLFNANSWTALNLPANAPFFPVSNRTAIVEEPVTADSPKYYRVRVFEP